MKAFLKALIDSDSRRVEAHIVLTCLGAVAFIALSAYHVIVLKNAFAPDQYGEGLGYLLAGGGAAAVGQGMQRKSEKGAKDESDQ